MIICSCTGVTDRDISQAIAWMRASDPYALVTPGKIYRALGKAPRCGGCIRLFVEHMRCDEQLAVPTELRGLRQRTPVTASRPAEPAHRADATDRRDDTRAARSPVAAAS
jgi:bacterioferritin-associated ferredoxin